MANVVDVAKYILEQRGGMTAIKLQKLVYYCQAWSLVWEEKPLFNEKIEAWANGPVTPTLFRKHQGLFNLSAESIEGNAANLTDEDRTVIASVLQTYGDKESQWLVELTHLEDPWKDARQGIPAGVRSNNEISHAAMAEYYSGL